MTTVKGPSKGALWTGRIISGVCILFMLFDSVAKLFAVDEVVKSTLNLGFAERHVQGIGITLFISTVLYAIPRTSVLGAILITGYLGGAVAIQVRGLAVTSFPVLFPILFAILVWAGIFVRNEKLKVLVPVAKD